jgi:hypothetical protein
MPAPSDATPRSPDDFARLLATPEPLLLVGGQAVNLWALYYEDRTRDLAPFVSRDADVLGDRSTLELLGKLAGTKPQFFPLKPPSNELGVVVARDVASRSLGAFSLSASRDDRCFSALDQAGHGSDIGGGVRVDRPSATPPRPRAHSRLASSALSSLRAVAGSSLQHQ